MTAVRHASSPPPIAQSSERRLSDLLSWHSTPAIGTCGRVDLLLSCTFDNPSSG